MGGMPLIARAACAEGLLKCGNSSCMAARVLFVLRVGSRGGTEEGLGVEEVEEEEEVPARYIYKKTLKDKYIVRNIH
jgi:hypothetical protein